jgi:multiple sugar transport system substrate-binding protein
MACPARPRRSCCSTARTLRRRPAGAAATTDDVIKLRQNRCMTRQGRYGIAWNAARGTALGHTFMMTWPISASRSSTCPKAGGFDTDRSSMTYARRSTREAGLAAAEYLMELLEYSPPDILSMSWYERVRPYAAGKSPWPMATPCLPPISSSTASPARMARPAILPHPAGPGGHTGRAGGRLCAGHSGQPAEERIEAAARR